MGSYCFGIDVGGTTVKCGLFQTDGNLVDKWEIPTRTENKAKTFFRMWQRLFKTKWQKKVLRKLMWKALESEFRDRSILKGKLHVR